MRAAAVLLVLMTACAGRPPNVPAGGDPTDDAGAAAAPVDGDSETDLDDGGADNLGDAGTSDGGAGDAGSGDAGSTDAGSTDAGSSDVAGPDATLEARLRSCTTAAAEVDVMLLISVDGMRSAVLQVLDDTRAPTLHALLRTGAGTLDARTDPDWSVTLPNHVGMVTGRTVNGEQGHHFTQNSDTGSTVHDLRGGYTSSVFDVAHGGGLRTSIFAAKGKFHALSSSWDAAHSADGQPQIDDVDVDDQSDDDVVAATLAVLASDAPRSLLFVHLKLLDQVGHTEGFDVAPGASYLAAAEATDLRLNQIVDAVVDDARRCGRTGLILTTDHGGIGYNHSDVTAPQNHTIPFIAWGPPADPVDLSALNAGRIIRNGDSGNLALHWLGLPAIPGSTLNASFDLITR